MVVDLQLSSNVSQFFRFQLCTLVAHDSKCLQDHQMIQFQFDLIIINERGVGSITSYLVMCFHLVGHGNITMG